MNPLEQIQAQLFSVQRQVATMLTDVAKLIEDTKRPEPEPDLPRVRYLGDDEPAKGA